MFVYKCSFFDDIDLLGLEPAHASVVWDLISEFNSQVSRASQRGGKSSFDSREVELALYHILQRAYPGGERRERAMAAAVGKIYHDLRFKLQEFCDGTDLAGTPRSDGTELTEFSNERLSKFIVTLVANGKTKSEVSKALGFHKSSLSRHLSKKTQEHLVGSSGFSLGLVSGREPIGELPERGNVIVDRLQPLTIRELHCCAIGSKIGQMIHKEKSILFKTAFGQLKRVREKVTDSMIELTGIDLKNDASISAFEGLCRQAIYAISDPDPYLFKRDRISVKHQDCVATHAGSDSAKSKPSASWLKKLEEFDSGKLLPKSNGQRVAYDLVDRLDEQDREEIKKYIQRFLESEADETSKIIANVHFKDEWIELINEISNQHTTNSAEHNRSNGNENVPSLILRQHSMLTRGLLELQMLAAYRFYVADASGSEREDRINCAVEAMQFQLDQMRNRIVGNEKRKIADFVRADMHFHIDVPMILKEKGTRFLPADTSEMEKYLSLSLLGRNEPRFLNEDGRRQMVSEHEEILKAVKRYLGANARLSMNPDQNGPSHEEINDLRSTKDLATALGKHLFKAIHDESDKAVALDGIARNMAQLQETALMFDLMLSQGFEFDPISFWERGDIDRLIYLSDCYPPKELILSRHSRSEDDKHRRMVDQIRLVLALNEAISKSEGSRAQGELIPPTMAIFVSDKDFIKEMIKRKLVDLDKLIEAYGDADFNCESHIELFIEEVRQLFKDLRQDKFKEKILAKVRPGERKSFTQRLEFFVDKYKNPHGNALDRRVTEILDSIKFFDLPSDIHRQFIIEAGGTVAWHLQGNNLVYTYRQDGNEGVSRAIDARGDRSCVIFDLIYSMMNKGSKKKDYEDAIHNGKHPEFIKSVLQPLSTKDQSSRSSRAHVGLGKSDKSCAVQNKKALVAAATILLMISQLLSESTSEVNTSYLLQLKKSIEYQQCFTKLVD